MKEELRELERVEMIKAQYVHILKCSSEPHCFAQLMS